jgi:hypothetical protein
VTAARLDQARPAEVYLFGKVDVRSATLRLLLGALLLAALLQTRTAAAQSAGVAGAATTTTARFRRQPNAAAGVIRTLTPNTPLEVLSADAENGYLRVRAESGDEGFVYKGALALKAGVWGHPEAVESTGPSVAAALHFADPPVIAAAPQAYHSCGLEGDAVKASVKQLNRGKNRFQSPGQVVGSVTLADVLHTGDDTDRFNPANAAELTGFVVDVKVGGVETANCKATDPKFRDTHIEVAQTKTAAETRRVIVEVTPRWRAAFASQKNLDLSTAALQWLCGHRVRFRGWLLFDAEHADEARNTDPGDHLGQTNWRATAWELHPVTTFDILDDAGVDGTAKCLTQFH